MAWEKRGGKGRGRREVKSWREKEASVGCGREATTPLTHLPLLLRLFLLRLRGDREEQCCHLAIWPISAEKRAKSQKGKKREQARKKHF